MILFLATFSSEENIYLNSAVSWFLGHCRRKGAKNPAYWTFFSNNPAYWTFFSFLLRVKNIAFCLCFGLIHSLGICQKFVGIVGLCAFYLEFYNSPYNPAHWTFFLFLSTHENACFCLLFWSFWKFENLSEICQNRWIVQRSRHKKKQKKSRDEHLPQMLGLGRRYIYIDIYRAEPFSVNCKSCTLTSTV